MKQRIKGFEDYIVYDDGRIWSDKSKKFLKQYLKRRYYSVRIRNEYGVYDKRVHRLVAQEFVKKEAGKNVVHHINGDRLDNNAKNLRWVTTEENNNDPRVTERTKEQLWGYKEIQRQMKSIVIDGITYPSYREAERQTGLSRQSLRYAVKNGNEQVKGHRLVY